MPGPQMLKVKHIAPSKAMKAQEDEKAHEDEKTKSDISKLIKFRTKLREALTMKRTTAGSACNPIGSKKKAKVDEAAKKTATINKLLRIVKTNEIPPMRKLATREELENRIAEIDDMISLIEKLKKQNAP